MTVLSERERKELADIERRLERDDPGLARCLAQQPTKRGGWWVLCCLVGSVLVLCAGLFVQDSRLILLSLTGFLLAGILAALRLDGFRDGDHPPGPDGVGWPRWTL